MSEVRSTFSLKPGDRAPEFSLPNPTGDVVSLADSRGEHGLLVAFVCNHCPFVVHLAKSLGELAETFAEEGVKTVAINSNDIANYPQDAPEPMAVFARENGWDFPYLFDETQEVAKAYGAACTPDFFLFDRDGRLFYAGQLDETRPRRGEEPDGRDLVEAVKAMLAGQPAITDARPSSGCNIKWKPGNEPSYFG